MNLRRIAAGVLASVLIVSQGTALRLPVSAQEINLGSEERDTKEEVFYAQGKENFAKIIADHTVYALLYKSANTDIMEEPSYQGTPVVNLRTGHQVSLIDVVYEDGQTWYQVETMVKGQNYTGYLADEQLISADEEFREWRAQWLSQSESNVFAADAYGSGSTDLSLFPESYRPYIKALIQAHPNWTFVPLNTGLDWDVVMENEMVPSRSLVPLETMDTWKESNEVLSAPYWVQASESIVRYYLDPRNFLNEEHVFQFELLAYNSSNHKLSGVKSILKNTFMDDAILEGTDMTYAEAFLKIGKELKISPYHLAGRVRQEQGVEGTSPLISGNYPGHEGLYNYFNIQAAGVTYDDIIKNGFIEAEQEGWTDRYSALYGGSEKVGNNYIRIGQNTLYLQKFDVDDTDGILYWHQYMQNLLAAANESKSVRKGYEEMGVVDNAFVFSVPVYENMPVEAVKIPKDTLEQPSLKTSIKKFTDVTLNWTEIPGAQGYEIYRSQKETGGYKKIETLTSVGILDWEQTVSTNKIYYYKVRGYKTFQGVTAYSEFSPVKKVSSVIPVPEGSVLKQNSYAKLTMSWEKAKNVTGYEVYRKTGKDGAYERIADTKELSFADTTISPKHTYYYKVRSYKVLEGKKHYSQFSEEQSILIRMEAPVLNSALLSNKKKLTLQWDKKKWVTGYQIYRAGSRDGNYKLVQEIKGKNTETYIDDTAQADHVYYYKIRSYVTINGTKKYSVYSEPVLAEVNLTKPVFKKEYVSSATKIKLKWIKNPIASGYEIQQRVDEKWNTVATIKKNAASNVISKLQAGTTYPFRIRAYKKVRGEIYYSSYVYLNATTAPEKIVINSVSSNSKKHLRVSWNPIEKTRGYQVQISLNKDFKEAEKYQTETYVLRKKTTKVKNIKPLTSGKKYYVRVRAYRIKDNYTVCGKWSERKAIKVK